ncbi:hypothetical protein, partial [Streptococcus pyogenes]|uniref:hypothetical protein n=1 Tax=Streptococcus pyogenes TaxID=1314 RepID=UPI001F377FFD
MKKHLKTVALTLTTVSVVTHNQEVFSLVKEPILKQTQASSSISGADYAESSGKSKLKINETSGPVDDTVTDLFSDKRTTPEKIRLFAPFCRNAERPISCTDSGRTM